MKHATQIPAIKSIEIYGREVRPAAGDYVEYGDRNRGGVLLAGDDFADSGYRGSQFRMTTDHLAPTIKSLGVDVEITGRTMQLRNGGDCYVRVRITFVGDCEADSHVSGWLLVDADGGDMRTRRLAEAKRSGH